jgi:hypothetical protein
MLRRLVIASVILLIVSLALIPISYTPARVSKSVDMLIKLDSNVTGYLGDFIGLEGGVIYIEDLELYGNLSCYRGIVMRIYYARSSSSIYLNPGDSQKLPLNDTGIYISLESAPTCFLRIWGTIIYNVYRYLWISAISFILGLAGGIILLRALAIDLSRRASTRS